MQALSFSPDATDILSLGVGAALLGVALLPGRASSSRRRRLAVALAFLALAAVATWLPPLAEFSALRMPLLALAGAAGLCLLLSGSYPRRLAAAALALAGRPRLQGAALLAAGLLAIAALPWLLERQVYGTAGKAGFATNPRNALAHQRQLTAYTDRGAPVDVFDVGEHGAQASDLTAEAELARPQALGLHLIRTAPPDEASNCHGWVFTGGRYLVDGGDVDRILQDNGYDAVTAPRVGDLVIYRLGEGNISHTALVRVVTDDGLVLLESKWSSLGRYLHRPEDYCPGSTWAYYRSPRQGHLLRGLDPNDPTPGASAAAAPRPSGT